MSNIIFPEGVTWTQRYMTGGDILTSNDYIVQSDNLYKSAKNSILIINVDTSKVTDMSYMFNGCSEMLYISQFDTSNVTNMNNMFQSCSSLTTIPHFDISKVTTMQSMLYGCSKLTSVPHFDTSKVTNMGSIFQNCSSLKSVPLLDCSSISSGSNINIFASSTAYVTDLGGFKDLGKVKNFNKPSYFLKYCANLTKESVLNVLNNLYDRASAGYSVVTLPFHANALALLSDEEKAIATNKGWTLATS